MKLSFAKHVAKCGNVLVADARGRLWRITVVQGCTQHTEQADSWAPCERYSVTVARVVAHDGRIIGRESDDAVVVGYTLEELLRRTADRVKAWSGDDFTSAGRLAA